MLILHIGQFGSEILIFILFFILIYLFIYIFIYCLKNETSAIFREQWAITIRIKV